MNPNSFDSASKPYKLEGAFFAELTLQPPPRENGYGCRHPDRALLALDLDFIDLQPPPQILPDRYRSRALGHAQRAVPLCFATPSLCVRPDRKLLRRPVPDSRRPTTSATT